MTQTWKLKTNSSNILLVLITLILIKAEWTNCQSDEFHHSENTIEDNTYKTQGTESQIYIGNDEISRFFFKSSTGNNSVILSDLYNCLETFQLTTCLKMLLLDEINSVTTMLKSRNSDVHFIKGLIVLKQKNETNGQTDSEGDDGLSLDEEIAVKFSKVFRNRSLRINLLPSIALEIEPKEVQPKDNFVCFNYKFISESNFVSESQDEVAQGRKKRKGGGGMSMMMMVPQLIMLGLMPFTLASLKAMVMNAVMINMMALNGAIFMTIRNLVFGPRRGDNVKYVNYGYSKDRQTQSPKPVLIIHSPAAFAKQPKVPKRPIKYHPSIQMSGHYYSNDASGQVHLYRSSGQNHEFYAQKNDYENQGHNQIDSYENKYNRRYTAQKNEPNSFVFGENIVRGDVKFSNNKQTSYQRNVNVGVSSSFPKYNPKNTGYNSQRLNFKKSSFELN